MTAAQALSETSQVDVDMKDEEVSSNAPTPLRGKKRQLESEEEQEVPEEGERQPKRRKRSELAAIENPQKATIATYTELSLSHFFCFEF